MKQITLNTKTREELGRTASKHMRQNGIIPAVIYGESGSKNLALNNHEFKMAYRQFVGSAALFELKMDGEEETQYAIIQELQRNTRTDAFLHVDFKEIVRGQDMEADIPVVAFGLADGVRNFGGVLEMSAHTLRVRCRPRALPEVIKIDVTELALGHTIKLSEVTAPEGVTFLDDPEMDAISCVGSSAGASGATEEGEEEEEVADVAGASDAESTVE